MYNDIAPHYDRLYARFKDYEGEARHLNAIVEARHPRAASLLDVGCGTGTHLGHLRERFEVAGVDISPGLLAIARGKLPDVPLHQGDMKDFDLGRRFDVVTCLFGSIGYARDVPGLRRAIGNLARHVAPGGLLLLEPWLAPDAFKTGPITHNVVDEPGFRASWMYVGRREGDVSVFDIHYLVGTPEGVSHYQDRQELGLFDRGTYGAALAAAGLEVLQHDPKGLHGYGMYVCRAA